MANTYFKFKQFTIEQDRCAMKVGTDGVLLGAWAPLPASGKILDVGTGTGLVALMVAQRSDAEVVGIDISEDACSQAAENAKHSPWNSRVTILHQDVKTFDECFWGQFDSIVSNPPYFKENVKCPGSQRNTARHTDDLDFSDLVDASCKLLKEEGTLSVVLPADVALDFIAEALSKRLFLFKQTWIHTKPNAVPKRVLMAFSKKQSASTEVVHMTIHEADHSFSDAYKALTEDFYLDR